MIYTLGHEWIVLRMGKGYTLGHVERVIEYDTEAEARAHADAWNAAHYPKYLYWPQRLRPWQTTSTPPPTP